LLGAKPFSALRDGLRLGYNPPHSSVSIKETDNKEISMHGFLVSNAAVKRRVIMALAAAFVLSFTACDEGGGNTSETVLGIKGPEWVKAKAYPGANLITWAFTKDAKNYSVYRQRSDGSDALKLLTSTASQSAGPGEFYYTDSVEFDNQLADAAEYTYYVSANSGQGITGRAAAAGGATIINDGASSVKVKANIPARGTDVTQLVLVPATEALTEAAITAEKVTTITGAEELLLTWPNNNPAFQYAVKYDLGTAVTFNASSLIPLGGGGGPQLPKKPPISAAQKQ
jgi:hypothetical protein